MILQHAKEWRLRAALSAMVLGSSSLAMAQPDAPPGASPTLSEPRIAMPSWAPLAKRVLPAVVNIAAEIPAEAADQDRSGDDEAEPADKAPTPFEDFLHRYRESRTPPPSGTPLSHGQRTASGQKVLSVGSAFIIDPTGYIVTNNHVIARAQKITVIFADNSRRAATVVGTDPKLDIALLKVSVNHRLPFLQWGDSDKVQTGDWVMTVGNPFGLGGTVTAGIISALGRDLQQGPFDDFLQIDAPINRGSSGGPTFDTTGRVVGVNAAIYSPTGGNVGIGFAIPSNLAKVVAQNLRNNGHADHGFLGISVQLISPDIAQVLQMDPERPKGLLVNEVAPDGPAEKAGIIAGDVITEVNGHMVQVPHDISTFVITAKPGDRLRLSLDRNNRQKNVELIVARTPNSSQPTAIMGATGAASPDTQTVLGLWFAELTPDTRRELQLAPSVQGVVIGGMGSTSSAAAIGLMPGDVVMSINRHPVTTPADALIKLRAAAGEGEILILVDRHGNRQFMVLPKAGGPDDE